MWKIIKQQVETIQIQKEKFKLWMKWEFFIEFVSDRFGPYEYKFERQDTYFSDGLQDRWSKIFPLKEKKFNNTELFFENDDIVITVWKRLGLSQDEKYFLDVINIKTEKKYRIFTEEVSIVVLLEEGLLINFNDNGTWKSINFNIKTLEIIKNKEEKLYAFFKVIYNETENKWYKLNFVPKNLDKDNLDEEKYQNGFFIFEEIKKIKWKPVSFDREKWEVKLKNWINIDIWEESI